MKPKKLEDIGKENIFETPEGYFDKLPLQIQQRVEEKKRNPMGVFSPARLRIAIPSLAALGIALFFWLGSPEESTLPTETHQEFLSEFTQEEVRSYLLTEGITPIELTELAESEDLNYTVEEISTESVEEELLYLDVDLIDVQTIL